MKRNCCNKKSCKCIFRNGAILLTLCILLVTIVAPGCSERRKQKKQLAQPKQNSLNINISNRKSRRYRKKKNFDLNVSNTGISGDVNTGHDHVSGGIYFGSNNRDYNNSGFGFRVNIDD